MALLHSEERHLHPGSAPGLPGNRGDDQIDFTIESEYVYDHAEIVDTSFQNGNAEIHRQPNQGQTGILGIRVHWWYEKFGHANYKIKIYKKFGIDINTPGRILLFEHVNFEGRFKEIRNGDPDLTKTDGGFFNDQVSSIVVLSGNWKFFKDINLQAPYLHNNRPLVLGPGMYSYAGNVNIQNDDLSSLYAVTDPINHP